VFDIYFYSSNDLKAATKPLFIKLLVAKWLSHLKIA